MRSRTHFPKFCSWYMGSQLPLQLEEARVSSGASFHCPPTTPPIRKVVPAIPLSCPKGWFTCTSVYGVNATVVPRSGTVPIILTVAAGEELGQFPHLLHVVRGKEGFFSLTHGRYHLFSHSHTQGQLCCAAHMRRRTLFPECFSL